MLEPRLVVNGYWAESGYGKQLLRLAEELLDIWFDYHKNPPKLLYHYTTADGLIGILKTNKMWATHTRYLNDASELIYTQDLIVQHLQKQAETAHPEVVKIFYDRALRSRIAFDNGDNFVICFCENGDLLSQWRAYGNRGGGYAIGLDTRFIGYRWNPRPDFSLRKVMYDHALQNSLIESTLEKTARALIELTEDQTSEQAEEIVGIVLHFLSDLLSEFFCAFKHYAFQEEQEWRVILPVTPSNRDHYLPQLQFRSVSGSLIPYLELDLSSSVGPKGLPISTILHGPTLHPELARQSLEMALRKYRYPFAQVDGSKVPLRS